MITNEPAFNLDVEQQILGLMVKDSTHANSREAMDSLGITDFYGYQHQKIFEVC